MKELLRILPLLFIGAAQADIVEINAVPTAWKLESYTGNDLAIWYTASTCSNGKVTLPLSSTTAEDRNRLFALILAAKISQKAVFVRYDNTTADCRITSFGTVG